MQGIAAITANNGWWMALTGACIVMTGLATLSFIISQLHKFIEMLEKKKEPAEKDQSEEVPATDLTAAEGDILNDMAAAARIYKPLTANLGEKFSLAELYKAFDKENLPHPHITVRELRNDGYISSAGEGLFKWTKL